MDAVAPGVAEGFDLLGLAGNVVGLAVLHIAAGGGPLEVAVELDAVGRVEVDALDLAAQALALGSLARRAVRADGDFRSGWYSAERRPVQGLSIARGLLHSSERSASLLERRFGRSRRDEARSRFTLEHDHSVEWYLDSTGARFADRFDANALLRLSKAADLYDAGAGRGGLVEALRRVRARTLFVGFSSDGVHLPGQTLELHHAALEAGVDSRAHLLETDEGHEAFLTPSAELRRIAAATAAMHRVGEIRRTRVSGRMDNHERKVGTAWNVALQGQSFDVEIQADPKGATVTFDDGTALRVAGDWTPGDQLAEMTIDDAPLVFKVGKISGGFRVRARGADMKVHVRNPRQAELARLMPEKLPPDTSKMLLCPMPGLVVKIDVEVGDEVQEGQNLCTIEAMKMENILRAEKKGKVSKVNAAAGDSLAVDDVIIEFE